MLKITKFGLFFGKKSHFSDFLHLMRSKCCDKGVGRRYVFCVYPFGHHLKAGEVFLQGFQLATVATKDDARSGDHRSPAEEGKAAFDFFQLAFFIDCHDDAPVELNKLNKVATDEVVKFLQGFVAFSDIIFK